METRDPSSIDRNVSRRLLERRAELGISQPDLADQVGITYQQLQKYERGGNRISAGRLYDLAKALRTTIEYFYEGVPPPAAPSRRGASENGADFAGKAAAEEAELLAAFRQIRESVARNSLIALAKKQAKAARKPAGKSRK